MATPAKITSSLVIKGDMIISGSPAGVYQDYENFSGSALYITGSSLQQFQRPTQDSQIITVSANTSSIDRDWETEKFS